MRIPRIAACAVVCAAVCAKAVPQAEEELCKPGSQRGEVVYVNCKSGVPEDWIRFSMDYFTKETNFRITLRNGAFALPNPGVQGSASLFLTDDPSLPPMLVAPESRWAMVNMAPLKCADKARFEARVRRELSRGFAFLCGGGESQFRDSLMSVVRTDQLDAQEDHRLPVDVTSRFVGMMDQLGVTPAVYGDYETACQEGWAPTPTNDIQKAIWEKVHTPPSRPLKIQYDPATQKGKVTK